MLSGKRKNSWTGKRSSLGREKRRQRGNRRRKRRSCLRPGAKANREEEEAGGATTETGETVEIGTGETATETDETAETAREGETEVTVTEETAASERAAVDLGEGAAQTPNPATLRGNLVSALFLDNLFHREVINEQVVVKSIDFGYYVKISSFRDLWTSL